MPSADISLFLEKCKPQKVAGSADYDLEQWLKTQVNKWIANVSLLLWFIAVAVLVYAGYLFQFAAWEDENITKAKNVVKYTLLWVFLLISSGSIIYVIINTVYFVAEK
jgi:voltage-gated potassium channel Kch